MGTFLLVALPAVLFGQGGHVDPKVEITSCTSTVSKQVDATAKSTSGTDWMFYQHQLDIGRFELVYNEETKMYENQFVVYGTGTGMVFTNPLSKTWTGLDPTKSWVVRAQGKFIWNGGPPPRNPQTVTTFKNIVVKQ
jgi:hypothetical protein